MAAINSEIRMAAPSIGKLNYTHWVHVKDGQNLWYQR